MKKIISQEEIDKYMSLEGKVRGTSIKSYGEYIFKEEGAEGLKKLEDAMSELGCPIAYKEIKAMSWYPISQQVLTLDLIQKLFDYDDKKFQEIGKFSSKFSLIVRLLIKYILRRVQTGEKGPEIWKKLYTVGELEEVEVDIEKGRAVWRIKNFSAHPLLCQVIIGYLTSLLQMVMGYKVICEETKCVHQGDSYHEFLIKKATQ